MKSLFAKIFLLFIIGLLILSLASGDLDPYAGQGSGTSGDTGGGNSGNGEGGDLDPDAKPPTKTVEDTPDELPPPGQPPLNPVSGQGSGISGDTSDKHMPAMAPPVPSCFPSWHCSGSSRIFRNADCSFDNAEFCPHGCSNGECQCAILSCSHYSGQCGSFSNGCGGTLECSCGAGRNCVSGKCCLLVVCAKGECGLKRNECGQSVECGSCEADFYCNASNRCVQKRSPDISRIRVFASSTHALITWLTAVEADSMVLYGESEQFGLREFSGIKTSEHSVLLHGLKPETAYFFKAISSADGLKRETDVLPFITTPFKDEPLQILAILVNPESREQFEGQSFSFTAVTNCLNPDELEFYWDFGDDSNSLKKRPFHAYYGLGMEKEKEFVVRVIVKDVNGRSAGAEVKVRVLKSKFKAIVFEPSQSKINSKEKDLSVRLEFLDEEDQKIDCNKINLRVLLAGSLLEMKCHGTVFEGIFRPWLSLSELELLEIFAFYNANGERLEFRTRAPVYFEPVLFRATDAFKGKTYFLMDSLENSKVRFLMNGIVIVFPTKVRATLVSGKKEKEVRIEKNEYDYTLYFDHTVNETDFLQGLRLKLQGRDAAGNRLEELQAVPVKENPALVIAVLEPLEGERSYAFGQVVSLKARILSDNYKVKGKKVFVECADLELLEELEFDNAKQHYSAEILLPLPESGKKSIDCRLTAYGTLDGKELMDFEFFSIGLSNKLQIEFFQPSSGLNRVWGGEIRELKTRVFQPNNHLFKSLGLEGELSVDGENQNVFLEFDERERLHKVLLSAPLSSGTHTLRLVLKGDFRGEGAVVATIERGVPRLPAISLETAVPAVVAFAVLLFLALFLRNSFRERGFLFREKERLLGIEKKYRFEFFKRRISESELSERVRRLGKGVKCVDSLLGSGFWAYTGFLKTFFWTKNLKRVPERVQAAVLTTRLSGRIGEFSREETARGLRNEGYSERVIEKVLERLYKER